MSAVLACPPSALPSDASTPSMTVVPEFRGAGNLDTLLSVLAERVIIPSRDASGPFVMAVDHCFPIRGHGTVATGTVLRGTVSVGDNIEFASMGLEKKVKSIQSFKKPVERAVQGDRCVCARVCGVCVR
jgi:selenocysteine-specific elongation factor